MYLLVSMCVWHVLNKLNSNSKKTPPWQYQIIYYTALHSDCITQWYCPLVCPSCLACKSRTGSGRNFKFSGNIPSMHIP